MPIDMRTFKLSLMMMLPVVLLGSCSKNLEDARLEAVPITLNANEKSVVVASNQFAFNVFAKINNEAADANVIISPLSISYALSMAQNGANGTTRQEMLNALALSGLKYDEINATFKSLTATLLNVDSRVAVSVANSLWAENRFAVKQPFIDILVSYYNAEARKFDISNPAASLSAINGWISNKTKGMIPEMMNKLSPDAVMLLINAICFEGKWQNRFDKADTKPEIFYKRDGTQVLVPTMRHLQTYKMMGGENFAMLELPYGQGNYAMDIILPNTGSMVDSIARSLTQDVFNGYLSSMFSHGVNVYLPRFKYGFGQGMVDVMKSLGMHKAFSPIYADFSNITDSEQIFISDIQHKAFIETNEEGTKAAAATVVTFCYTSVEDGIPYEFRIDRPFIYIIRETTTNTILFMGRVMDPSIEG